MNLQRTIWMKHREVAAMSKLQNLTLWKEANKTISMANISRWFVKKWTIESMIQPCQNFQFIFCRFYGDDKTLKADLKHPFRPILNIRGLNIQLKRMRLFVSAVASGERKVYIFFYCLESLKKLSTKYNGPRQTVFFCSDIDWIWFISSWQCIHIESFIENSKL